VWAVYFCGPDGEVCELRQVEEDVMDLGLKGKTAVVTGGGGAICGEIAKGLSEEGARVAVWDLDFQAAKKMVESLAAEPDDALAVECDVLDKKSVERAAEQTIGHFGTVDILINGAGGSRKEATTSPDLDFFDIGTEALSGVVSLNYLSAVIPSQVIGRLFAKKKAGVILNISSVAGFRPLTRSIGYCNGKAATNSFTQWLAVHMAQNYSPEIRVNAVAPGFILTEQNRFLLQDSETGRFTERGKKIVGFVPMARLGKPEEVVGAALWAVSERAGFVTGTVISVDGGFSVYSGV